jgi:hypothetical protein
MFGGRRGKASPSFRHGGSTMKTEIIKGLANLAEDVARGVVGKSLSKTRKAGDTDVGTMANSIIDTMNS